MQILPRLLTKEEFKIYGKVISIENEKNKTINSGFAKKYYELCNIDANEQNGIATLHIYLAKKRDFPLCINMLEKHPFFSQTFIPRSKKPFLLLVAKGENKPDISTLKAFITNGNQGVHYKRGIWHFPLISLANNEEFIVIDRSDKNIQENKITECVEHFFINKNIILKRV